MKIEKLLEELLLEYLDLDLTVKFIDDLRNTIGNEEPTINYKAAITLHIANFYNGIENILKRICKYLKVTLPYGSDSHIVLFQMFSDPSSTTLPYLFDLTIINDFIGLRKFRHYAMHGYAFKIDWNYMKDNIVSINEIYYKFKVNVEKFLQK
jgi:hypothetical protein